MENIVLTGAQEDTLIALINSLEMGDDTALDLIKVINGSNLFTQHMFNELTEHYTLASMPVGDLG